MKPVLIVSVIFSVCLVHNFILNVNFFVINFIVANTAEPGLEEERSHSDTSVYCFR
jgi:hypothetical protein